MAATKKTRKSKGKREELVGQTDPRAPLDSAALLAAAKPVLQRLEEDLQSRAMASPAVTAALTARYEAEKEAQRTAESFAGWTAALATQVAAAWLLSCVFVRALEDRGLLKQARLAGPGAEDSQKQFFQLAPSLTERDYLLTVFRELAHHPAAKDLFDVEHSLVWKLSPSAEVAKELLALFRAPTASEPAFRFGQPTTRFLGDLYQDLSEDVRKRYALLQTPDFVEAYILDHTLEPAIARFGLDDTTLIDPTCGSGHFLLGAFDRLFEHRLRAEPGIDARVAATKALDCVYGADINPYAVAIARFRLTLAFLDKAGYAKLADAPALPLHLVIADSLRINPQHPQQELWQHAGTAAGQWLGDVFAYDDEHAAIDVLGRQYAAVVANPPYITVKDAALREVYRAMYTAAAGKYALSAPYCERIFQLARPRGYTGQITANSFMKREFGKRLIEEYLPTVNLERIVNTSGAYIPGHGTPTVLLFGTNETCQGNNVHAVLAKRGEPSAPDEPSQGLVWRSIVDHGEDVGFENEYLSVARVGRDALARHPWSLGGGGAAELKELLEEGAKSRLGDIADSIGISCVTGEDEVFLLPGDVALRQRVGRTRSLVTGEFVRDWSLASAGEVLFPYNDDLDRLSPEALGNELKYLWPYRTSISRRRRFGVPMLQRGLTWFELQELYVEKLRTPLTITLAEVATHNHFVLDRGGRVFKNTAPIIKLPASATEDDHLALLAYLNSSTACFWMKQVCFDKGNRGEGGGFTSEEWEKFFQFNSSALADLPLPEMDAEATASAVVRARRLSGLAAAATQAADLGPIFERAQRREDLDAMIRLAISNYDECVGELRTEQERLDWWVYSLVGLADSALANQSSRIRASDVLFARNVLGGHPGERYFNLCHLSAPSIVARASVPPQHLAAIAASPQLSLIERPTYKRTFREGFRPIDAVSAAKVWLAAKLEHVVSAGVEARSLANIVDELSKERQPRVVVEWTEALEKASGARLKDLVATHAVPFCAAIRYSESGLAKYSEWCSTWELQREEDRGGPALLTQPDRYSAKDFLDPNSYRLRGPLDVPKERFISYAYCESDNDGEPVYGWAGWNHLQRSQALASLYLKRKDGEGWTKDRLTPMLAGLLELIPWVEQWHNEPSDEFGGLRMGDYFEQFLDGECRQHGLTHADLRAWRPPQKTRGGAKKSKPKKEAASTEPEEQATGDGAEASPKPKKSRSKKKPATADATPATTEAE